MIVLFGIELALLVFLHIRSRDAYDEFLQTAGGKKYPLRGLMPISLYLTDRIKTSLWYSYERELLTKLSVLHGVKNSKYNLRMHLAKKISLIIAATLGITLLGVLTEKPDISYLIFSAVVLVLIFYLTDREIEEQIKKRNFMLQYDFPEFLNKLVLLINAGMTVPRAWEKIVCDRKDITPLYEELNTTYIEIQNGKSEIAAYEDFARRCRVKEITKFVTAVIQNQRKGNAELVSILKLQSNECWQARKSMAKRLGEEASTKLVFPLMIMFLGILIIVLTPAILQLRKL